MSHLHRRPSWSSLNCLVSHNVEHVAASNNPMQTLAASLMMEMRSSPPVHKAISESAFIFPMRLFDKLEVTCWFQLEWLFILESWLNCRLQLKPGAYLATVPSGSISHQSYPVPLFYLTHDFEWQSWLNNMSWTDITFHYSFYRPAWEWLSSNE